MMNIKSILSNRLLKRISIIIISALVLTACGEEKIKLPEKAAEKFAKAVYNSQDIDEMKQHSNEKMATIIGHYRSIKMIQRNIMELSLEPQVTIEVKSVGGDFFRKSKKDTKVELHIRGNYEGGIKADDRFLLMTWVDGSWKVKRVTKS